MRRLRLNKDLARWLRLKWRRPERDDSADRAPLTHVIILDGTMSTLEGGHATNAGLAYQLLQQTPDLSLYYEPGLQWTSWRSARDVLMGRGINRQIKRAYGYLASRYRPGDRIYLLGYSRGAYAVRSLAGLIDRIGLLRCEAATERNIQEAYDHYRHGPNSSEAHAFRTRTCHDRVEIEMVGVWDTVKSLGLNMPVLWRLSVTPHAFHNHALSGIVRNGFHALAHDETRVVYRPVLWDHPTRWQGRLEQVWFPGTHGDVGGQLGGLAAARALSNIPFVWMLEAAQSCGLPLPEGWQSDYPQDPMAPSVGTWRQHGKLFFTRRKRVVGRDRSERLHDSVHTRRARRKRAEPQRLPRGTTA